jgi:hypothetical protein
VYQELVFEKVNEICSPFGDTPSYVADVVGKLPKSKVGDIVIEINPDYTGGAILRLVIEAKDRSSYNVDRIITELDEAKNNRDACFALAAFTPDTCPSKCSPLQQYGDDKIVCVCDPDDSYNLSLQLSYRVARIEAIRRLRGSSQEVDFSKLHALLTQCQEKLTNISNIKRKVTRLSSEVNLDLDTFCEELEGLFRELDSVTMQVTENP